MREKKIPRRMCISCRNMKNKNELIRIVKTPNDEIVMDLTGKLSGRGAYICQDRLCIEQAKKQRKLERNFENIVCAHIYSLLLAHAEKNDGE